MLKPHDICKLLCIPSAYRLSFETYLKGLYKEEVVKDCVSFHKLKLDYYGVKGLIRVQNW